MDEQLDTIFLCEIMAPLGFPEGERRILLKMQEAASRFGNVGFGGQPCAETGATSRSYGLEAQFSLPVVPLVKQIIARSSGLGG